MDLVIQAMEINSKLLWKELYLMDPHLTTSTVSISSQNAGGAAGIRANRTDTAFDTSTRTQSPRTEPDSALRSVSVWAHTLILTGELTHRSAHMLEVEIERLCEQGVTDITLDLRQLTCIDSIGVAVISFRCDLCRRLGYGFTLIPGSRIIHRAFEQAGVIDLLPFQGDEVAARRLRASIPDQRSADRKPRGASR
ncbi:MAG TPA: STAS domain-containing protein [Solirubrobacteraceae bacterium]|nr:STAS domain-containing protein [Solirubrobacteraceae bacterium]